MKGNKMSDTYLVEIDMAGESGAVGVIAVTVDSGDTATDAVIAVHNGYREKVAVTDNGGRYYRTAMDGTPLTFHVDAYNRVRVI